MQVRHIWIVESGGHIRSMYETWSGKFYLTSHIAGHLRIITKEEADELKSK